MRPGKHQRTSRYTSGQVDTPRVRQARTWQRSWAVHPRHWRCRARRRAVWGIEGQSRAKRVSHRCWARCDPRLSVRQSASQLPNQVHSHMRYYRPFSFLSRAGPCIIDERDVWAGVRGDDSCFLKSGGRRDTQTCRAGYGTGCAILALVFPFPIFPTRRSGRGAPCRPGAAAASRSNCWYVPIIPAGTAILTRVGSWPPGQVCQPQALTQEMGRT